MMNPYFSSSSAQNNSARSTQSFQHGFSSPTAPLSRMPVYPSVGKHHPMKLAVKNSQHPTPNVTPKDQKIMACYATPLHQNSNHLTSPSPLSTQTTPIFRRSAQLKNHANSAELGMKSSNYAAWQLKRKQTLGNSTTIRQSSFGKTAKSVVEEFPMIDFKPNKDNNFNSGRNTAASGSSETGESSRLSSLRNRSKMPVKHRPTNFHVRFGKAGYYPIENHSTGRGVLPDHAYKLQEISSEGLKTEELSADSLRQLNQKMRIELEEIDQEINFYQQQLNEQRKEKVTVT